MLYDYIIVGAGIAGPVCGYLLSLKGKKCLIIEQHSLGWEKVCGGGVSFNSLCMLEKIGIDINEIKMKESNIIKGHRCHYYDKIITKKYQGKKFAIGIQRHIFDGLLIDAALNAGVEIVFEQQVKKIVQNKGIFNVNEYQSQNLIFASGARRLDGSIPPFQSIGYVGQIIANSKLENDMFHFWYYEKDNINKYFWAFPIGNELWNVGIWNRNIDSDIKQDYQKCLEQYFCDSVIGSYRYKRKPKAEFLGHFDQRIEESFSECGLGDYAGCCNPINGGGIHKAIKSAIDFVEQINDYKDSKYK